MTREELAQLLHRWDLAMLAWTCGPLCEPILERQSVLCPPAPTETIEDSERRVGVSFPASYRDFLSLSNGARGDIPPLIPGDERQAVADPTMCLLPCEEVDRIWERHGEELEFWVLEMIYEEHGVHEDGQVVGDASRLPDALLISSLTWETLKYFLCLAPVDESSDGGGEGWEVWAMNGWEITRHVTFASFLAGQLRDTWLRPGPTFVAVNDGVTPGALDLPEVDAGFADWLDPPQIRRLIAAPVSDEVLDFLRSDRVVDRPFNRLAGAQVRAMHGDASELRACTNSDNPSVALAANATLEFLDAE